MPTTARATSFAVLLSLIAQHAPGQVPDWHRLPTAVSSATQLLAFDARRERMVRVDGSGFDGILSTWEWIDGHWTQRRPAHSPEARQDFALAYDPARERIVLFGGRVLYNWGLPGGARNDTWEYDGIDWVQRTPLNPPPPQMRAWLGFDYAANKLMLCGGVGNPVTPSAFHYDGTAYTPLPFPPTFAWFSALASDPVRQRIVFFDGLLTPATYEWNGANWLTMAPPLSPGTRSGARLAYSAARGTVVLHGGGTTALPMFEWDGSTWAAIPGSPPSPRAEHSACFDPTTNELFVAGGVPGHEHANERWDGAQWTSTDTMVGWEDFRSAYYDGNRRTIVVLLYGADGWIEWDGAHWRRRPSPLDLVYTRACFDYQRMRAVVVGYDIAGLETLEWDGTTWTAPMPSTLPNAARLTYHVGRGRVMACCASGLFEWDGTAWLAVAPGPGGAWPNPDDGNAVYDAAQNQIVCVASTPGGLLTATWNGATWSQQLAGAGPAARREFTLEYDPLRQAVVLFGGRDDATVPTTFAELWEWQGSGWTERVLAQRPPARSKCGMVFDPRRAQLLVFGGERYQNSFAAWPVSDLWALDSQPAADVVVLGPGCAGAGSAPALVVGTPHPGADRVAFELHGAEAAAPCAFAFASASALVPLGAGCVQYFATPLVVLPQVTDAAGIGTAALGMPLALSGFAFVVQAAVLDVSSPLGSALTEGQRVVVGH